ncbi:uncharacterized protein N0V96_002376 [Colletotrichum fioriniae]|uniref:uncharacterized protein n=1 Tax=Colletotrichum fioriniae TaxID=710243 RepID=UPI0032DB0F8D|nr:hypothetical protein N0V96_002376 [Colletotrichum fioriniae]
MWRPEYMYSRPSQTSVFRKKAKPGEIFAKLPGEVLELILGELKKLHLEKPTESCATCWMRDVCSVTLTARKWCKFARVALYEDIQLVGADSASQKKRHKVTFGSRMMLLRRTLRANSYLAGLVHTLKVPSPPTGVLLEDYHNQVAALIMACPNFERLVGLHPHYNHSYSKLMHALSSRKRLKHMDWIVEPSPFQRQHRFKSSSGSNVAAITQATYDASVTPGDLQPHQSAAFLDFHVDWAHLTTLSIHCLPGATLTPDNLISSTLTHLTSLQHLYLSWMPVTAFNDSTLLSLPPLRTLSLTHVPGVTSSGISALATLPTSQAIQKLTLRHTNLDSLPALARIFSNFTHLDLRSPNDPEGIFQALCRPQERTDSASDRFRGPNGPARSSSFPIPNTTHSPVSPTKPSRSPTAPASPVMSDTPRECTNLHVARLAAQARLEAARAALPRFFLNVIDEDGTVLEKYGLAAFIGTVESRITYNLRPDPGAKDERGGLVELADLTADNGEEIAVGREGCQGRWNVSSTVADKKDRERWWHTERGRWQQPELA